MWRHSCFLLGPLLAATSASAVMAQGNPVTSCAESDNPGRVMVSITDAFSERPLETALVSIAGTRCRALSDSTGEVVFEQVDPGQRTVQILLIGYEERSLEVEVRPGQDVTVIAPLEQRAITLDEISVGPPGRRRDARPPTIGPDSGRLLVYWEEYWADTATASRVRLIVETEEAFPYSPWGIASSLDIDGRNIRLRVDSLFDPSHQSKIPAQDQARSAHEFPQLADSGHYSLRVVYQDFTSSHLLTVGSTGFNAVWAGGDQFTTLGTHTVYLRTARAGEVQVSCSPGRLEEAFCREFFRAEPVSAPPGYGRSSHGHDGGLLLELLVDNDGVRDSPASEAGSTSLGAWLTSAMAYTSFFPSLEITFDTWRGLRIRCRAGTCGERVLRPPIHTLEVDRGRR